MLDILTNETRLKKIEEEHAKLRAPVMGLNLLEILVVGSNWSVMKVDTVKASGVINDIIKFFGTWDYYKGETLSSFKLYDRTSLQHARSSAKFVKAMNLISYDLTSSKSVEELTMLSSVAGDNVSVNMAIKKYLLANFTDKEIVEFRGMQPQTGPVHNAIYRLFCSYESDAKHTSRCRRLADIAGISPSHINTGFYLLG